MVSDYQKGTENLHRLSRLNRFAKKMYEANPINNRIELMDLTEVQGFLQNLYDHRVAYMLVGGVATVFHGHVRTTQDLNLWVKENPENKSRLFEALRVSGVAGTDVYQNVQMIPGWSSITIGDKGFTADFMSYTKAFSKEDFDVCYKRATRGTFDGVPITVLHINDLITEKKELGRSKDVDDVINLKRIQKNQDKGMSF